MLKEKVIQAYVFAQQAHEGQTRKFTGFDYFIHPKNVARVLEDLTKDEDMIVCGLLHDTVEDCKEVTLEIISESFGFEIASIVSELTNDKQEMKKYRSKAEYMLNKMTLMSDMALIIKLADRYDNVKWMDKDCKTVEQKSFVQKYYFETTYILQHLERELNETHKLLIQMIQVELDYLKRKYLW